MWSYCLCVVFFGFQSICADCVRHVLSPGQEMYPCSDQVRVFFVLDMFASFVVRVLPPTLLVSSPTCFS